jgi:hypothetical protein
MRARIATVLAAAAAAGCGSFQDPNVVIDLRVLAIQSEPADQVVEVDLTQPPDPQALLAQLVPTEVCALVADPGQDRRLLWSMTMCPLTLDDRCDDDRPQVELAGGLLDDPDTTLPVPRLCAEVMPDSRLLAVLLDVLNEDDLKGLGGLDYAVTLRVGGENGDRALDLYATKTLRVSPRIPAEHAANLNPTLDGIDANLEDGAPVRLPLGRCLENPAPYVLAPATKLRLMPIEPAGARERYVVPTLDGRSESFTESLTYQWTASGGGYSSGDTGGPRDFSGNPAPLFTDFKSPAAEDLHGPTDIDLWIVQRDERLGVQWYESCLRVAP